MSKLEEELKRLKSPSFQKIEDYSSFKQSKNNNEANNIKKGLVIRSISKTYDKRKVVNKVSLDLHKGEAIGLLGPNGAGKTTCFYMIAGLINTDEGDITVSYTHLTLPTITEL